MHTRIIYVLLIEAKLFAILFFILKLVIMLYTTKIAALIT